MEYSIGNSLKTRSQKDCSAVTNANDVIRSRFLPRAKWNRLSMDDAAFKLASLPLDQRQSVADFIQMTQGNVFFNRAAEHTRISENPDGEKYLQLADTMPKRFIHKPDSFGHLNQTLIGKSQLRFLTGTGMLQDESADSAMMGMTRQRNAHCEMRIRTEPLLMDAGYLKPLVGEPIHSIRQSSYANIIGADGGVLQLKTMDLPAFHSNRIEATDDLDMDLLGFTMGMWKISKQ